MGRHCKYIIFYDRTNNTIEFKCGYVFYHRDLIPNYGSRYVNYEICGGGDFNINNEIKRITFSGYSSEFGRPSKDEFVEAFNANKESVLDDLSYINECINNIVDFDLNTYEIKHTF